MNSRTVSCGINATLLIESVREAMVHHLKMEALQVGNVAWNVERQNLPLPLAEHLVAEGSCAAREHIRLSAIGVRGGDR